MPGVQQQLRGRFTAAASADECVSAADCVVVMTPWREFKSLGREAFARAGRRKTVIDCWRILPEDIGAVAHLVHLGRGSFAVPVTTA